MDIKELDLLPACEWTDEKFGAGMGNPMAVYRFVKRLADILCSAVSLLLLSPLFLIITLTIKLTSRGPAIYRHERVGLNAAPICIYKFRTMYEDADNLKKYFTSDLYREFKENYKLEDDPRITKTGKFLRMTSLDELPQILNILRGQMSIVGPRPVTREELSKYGRYADMLTSVKPGLTGMWQVNGRSCCSYRERVLLDMNYVHSLSIKNDWKLILRTFRAVLSGKGAC